MIVKALDILNIGLPSIIVEGPGFGAISRRAGPSRQRQFPVRLTR
jgi:hypothetical protein